MIDASLQSCLETIMYKEYPTLFSSNRILFWRISICPYIFLLFNKSYPYMPAGRSLFPVTWGAINLAPEVKFSYSKIKFQRNFGSTFFIRLWRMILRLNWKSAIFFMAWNTVSIENSLSCPKKSSIFSAGGRVTSFLPFICPLSITGLIFCLCCPLSVLEARYHFFELWMLFYIDFLFRYSKNVVLSEITDTVCDYSLHFIWNLFWKHCHYRQRSL